MRSFSILCIASAVGVTPAMAGAPQALLDKTVTISWNSSGTAKRVDGAAPFNYTNISHRIIYISTAGRPFLKKQVRNGNRTREESHGPDEDSSKGGVSFQGNMLVGTEAYTNGARQYRVTFDASFASCTVAVILDAKSGSANVVRKGPDGAMYEVTNLTNTSPSCSIQSGNAFAH